MKKSDLWMTDKEYKFVCIKTPIPTIDLVILRKNKNITETLLLIRKTGYERVKWCIIGGRIRIGETIKKAIDRHALDLGVKVRIIEPFNSNFPAFIEDNLKQDKTKQPLGLVFPAEILAGKIRQEGKEFKGFKWFPINKLPKLAYDHKNEVITTLKKLKKFGRKK